MINLQNENPKKLREDLNSFIYSKASASLQAEIDDLIDEKAGEYSAGTMDYEVDVIEALEYFEDTRTWVISENKSAWRDLLIEIGKILPEYTDLGFRVSRLVPVSDEVRMSSMTLDSNGRMVRSRHYTKHKKNWYEEIN